MVEGTKTCVVCLCKFGRNPGERQDSYKKRQTCLDETCVKVASQKSNIKRCWCGNSQVDEEYCSWEHRLISIKCKQWGIPLTQKAYDKKVFELESEQSIINKASREVLWEYT